jgi:hypothetical protein
LFEGLLIDQPLHGNVRPPHFAPVGFQTFWTAWFAYAIQRVRYADVTCG